MFCDFDVSRETSKSQNNVRGERKLEKKSGIALPETLSIDFGKMETIIKKMWGNPAEKVYPLRHYALLLHSWSGRMSLVSQKDRDLLPTKHFLPALAMVPVIKSLPHENILDFGSGGGLPGIPLKIMLPETNFILLESRRRRANFLREVVRKLGLDGIEVVNERWENWKPVVEGVDLIVSRAVGRPEKILRLVGPFLRPYGAMLVNLDRGSAQETKVDAPLLLKSEVSWSGGKTWLGLLG